MMRFSCFSGHIPSHKPKKTILSSIEEMHKALQDSYQVKDLTDSTESLSLDSSLVKPQGDSSINNNDTNATSLLYVDRGWKSDERINMSDLESDVRVYPSRGLQKCQSLGIDLYKEGKIIENGEESEVGQSYSSDDCHDLNGLNPRQGGNNQLDQYQEDLPSRSCQVSSEVMNNESIFSIADSLHQENECHDNLDSPCDDFVGVSVSPPAIVKSCSFPNLHLTPLSGEGSPLKCLAPRSRSSLDLHVLEMRRRENSVHEVNTEVLQKQGRDDGIYKSDKNDEEIQADEAHDSYHYVGSAKEWIMPIPDEVNMVKNLQRECLINPWPESPSKDFKFKRIEDWVVDLQHCNSWDESGESSLVNDQLTSRSSDCFKDLTSAKMAGKDIPGMGAAKIYISSLSAAATTAQLTNHGLTVVPFLSAFVSLKVLNLSGNAIGRITAGALPRGLHMLNLSKNKISTIEGLRELTRLRILDLSYNRILRLGHGLASCSSLKELYLAGNKISEVEGLHRLLKLNVLDLRFNKISTAKSLGQLAANYNSLLAISLEGNPAQKNVGDEQLKKYLQGLLTHLAYYNRQPIKVGSLKDSGDRAVRLGSGSHQFDRGHRQELKPSRKGSHGSLNRASQAVVSPKPSRGRHGGRLPPSGTKTPASHRHHYLDLGKKIMNLRQELSIRKSRSEGNLGAL